MLATPTKPLKSVIEFGSPAPGGNRWNTSVPGPNGWIPPGIGLGSPARRAASAGPAPMTCVPRNPAAPSPAPAARTWRRLGACRWPGSSGPTVTSEERAANIATPFADNALQFAQYAHPSRLTSRSHRGFRATQLFTASLAADGGQHTKGTGAMSPDARADCYIVPVLGPGSPPPLAGGTSAGWR